jgi:hypothetical protein
MVAVNGASKIATKMHEFVLRQLCGKPRVQKCVDTRAYPRVKNAVQSATKWLK